MNPILHSQNRIGNQQRKIRNRILSLGLPEQVEQKSSDEITAKNKPWNFTLRNRNTANSSAPCVDQPSEPHCTAASNLIGRTAFLKQRSGKGGKQPSKALHLLNPKTLKGRLRPYGAQLSVEKINRIIRVLHKILDCAAQIALHRRGRQLPILPVIQVICTL